jgi:hypothetical protein
LVLVCCTFGIAFERAALKRARLLHLEEALNENEIRDESDLELLSIEDLVLVGMTDAERTRLIKAMTATDPLAGSNVSVFDGASIIEVATGENVWLLAATCTSQRSQQSSFLLKLANATIGWAKVGAMDCSKANKYPPTHPFISICATACGGKCVLSQECKTQEGLIGKVPMANYNTKLLHTREAPDESDASKGRSEILEEEQVNKAKPNSWLAYGPMEGITLKKAIKFGSFCLPPQPEELISPIPSPFVQRLTSLAMLESFLGTVREPCNVRVFLGYCERALQC